MGWSDGCLPDYGKSDPKYSFSRCPDGTGDFGLAVPSCNAANPGTAAGPIVTIDPDNPDAPDYPETIAVLRISTGVGIPTSKEDYIPATLTIEDPGLFYGDVASETVDTEIRGRGNTTWGMPKKPFKLKLDKKKRLLGMSDNRHWTLLANYSDKSLLRNSLAFKISELAGMEWAVRWEPVEVYIDDKYQGLYTLTEQVRTGDGRIEMDVVGAGDDSGDALTGGYLFCIDEKDLNEQTKVGFWHNNASGSWFPVAFDEPEDPTARQIAYAKSMFKEVEDAIYHKSFAEFSKVIDVESVIDYFFVQELAKNPDGNMRLSTYVAKPRGGKLYFPCVWDFDISFGNCDYAPTSQGGEGGEGGGWNPEGWLIRDAVWIRQMLRNKEFCDLVVERWNELRPLLDGLEGQIREWAAVMDDAQKRNFQQWNILGVYVWPNWNATSRKTYTAEVDFLVDFIKRRVEWLDREINDGRHRL
jgi:spore coat protein CotH